MARVPFSTALTGTLEDAGADLAADLRAAADIDTQIGTSTQAAINALDSEKEDNITAGTSSQVWQGDKTWVAKTDLPISTATQEALDDISAVADTALQPSVSTATRAGNILAVGQQANLDGNGKGGLLVGSGYADGGSGTYISADGLSNWLVVQSSKASNPTELIIYGSSGQGYAESVIGTGDIARLTGTEFSSGWIGRTIYFLRKKFKVSAVTDADLLTVTELNGDPVTFAATETEAFNYNYTTGTGVCNVSGSTVTRVSGDPFVPLFFRDFEFKINGTVRSVSAFVDVETYTLASPPGDVAGATFEFSGDINDQLATLRVQAIQGADEENVNLYTIAGSEFYGRYHALRAGLAGAYGQYRPIFIGAGDYGAYLPRDQVGIYPNGGPSGAYGDGYVTLGGVQGLEALRVYAPSSMATSRNRLDIQATASGTRPAVRAVGSDANVGFGLDVKGTGDLLLTQDFTRTLFLVQGAGATVNYAGISAATTGNAPIITAAGSDTNVDLRVEGQGTGGVRLGSNQANYLKASSAATTFAPAIRAQGSDSNISLGLDAKGSGGVSMTSDFARTIAKFNAGTSAVNYPEFSATTAGNAVDMSAKGSDTNIDLQFTPKGTGVVKFGTWTSNADAAVNGYVTIKDAAGNTRKLATIA
jgi:hypothetical protein